MEELRIVIYQNDPGTAQNLAVSLSQHFDFVRLTGSYQEVRLALTRDRADVLVLDLETSGPAEVEHLHHEFPGLCIVGTHRLADEELWTEALNRGASDICEPRQQDVVRCVLHSVSHGFTRDAAA
jgi:DNA-binding NarL/FixJ family response regulator